MRSPLTRYRGRWLPAALAAPLLLAACDGDGNTPAVPVETADSVRAAAAAVWPLETEAEPSAGTVTLTRTNIVAVLDMSGSMGETGCSGSYPTRVGAARAALAAWLDSVPAEANLSLVVFENGIVSLRVPLGTGNRQAIIAVVDDAIPGGMTPLNDAVTLARSVLEKQAARQRGYGEYRIVVITDGAHSEGQDPAGVINEIFSNHANPIELHTIGFCIEGSALNRPGVTYYRSADNPEDLRAGLESALAEADAFDITQFAEDGDQEGQ